MPRGLSALAADAEKIRAGVWRGCARDQMPLKRRGQIQKQKKIRGDAVSFLPLSWVWPCAFALLYDILHIKRISKIFYGLIFRRFRLEKVYNRHSKIPKLCIVRGQVRVEIRSRRVAFKLALVDFRPDAFYDGVFLCGSYRI